MNLHAGSAKTFFMADGTVLNIGVATDPDDIDVASDHAVIPDAGVVADFDISDDLSALGYVNPLSEFRPLPLVLMQHRQLP